MSPTDTVNPLVEMIAAGMSPSILPAVNPSKPHYGVIPEPISCSSSPCVEDYEDQMDCRYIQFCDRKSQIDYHQLQELFNLGAFWAKDRKIEDLELAIANSEPVISVWDANRLIGFARGTSDGVYRATIWDVVIHPDYRGAGLGRKLVETVLSHPQMSRVERVYLMTTHQQHFYERIGFESNSSTTMVINQPLANPVPTQILQSQESPRV